jgi:cytochrome P450
MTAISKLRRLWRPTPEAPRPASAPSGFEIDFYDPAVIEDPYPWFHRLRETAPLHKHTDGTWLLSRYEDVWGVLHDSRLLASRGADAGAATSPEVRRAVHEVWSNFGQTLLMTDPPDHGRVRSLMSPAFAPRVIAGMRPQVERIVDELLDRLGRRGRMDVVKDVAAPLPLRVICELVGVPREGEQLVKECSDDLHFALGLAPHPSRSPEPHIRGARSLHRLIAYVEELIVERRRQPHEDLLGALVILADEQPGRISAPELIANTILMLGAGHETTADLIGTGTLALLRNPGELQRLRDDPSLAETAVEELLRYESPVQLTGRRAAEDLELAGGRIAKDDWVTMVVGAANRDPAAFPDPDRLDVGREGPRQLAFSTGAHYCLGAGLARLETRVVLTAMLERFPSLELATDRPPWRQQPAFRGLLSLPVRFDRGD